MKALARRFFLASTLVSSSAAAQPTATTESAPALANSASWEMKSDNGRRYQIFAAWPSSPPLADGYPVFYVLDANIMFGTMVDTVRALSRRPGGQHALVIGVGYPADLEAGRERAFDLTPRLGSPAPVMAGTGGGEAFLKFIDRELKPDIARRYKIDPARESIFGHSFGGLFVLYSLVNNPGLFDDYIAASPSIWFENRLIAKGNVRKRLSAKLDSTGATPRVLVTVGEYEQAADIDFPPPSLPGLLDRKQVENAQEFAQFLGPLNGVDARFELIAKEDHGTVIPVAISRATRFVFARGSNQVIATAKPVSFVNRTGVPIPDAATYQKMSPQDRYELRLRSRKLPDAQQKAWVAEFDRVLSAGLTYGEHRQLAEEREAMGKARNEAPR